MDSKQEITFTKNQVRAMTTLGRNLCVTAGAGSGKTTVLVERYLYLIEKGGMDIQEIVAITFTEKAANQMKEKIRSRIREKVETASDENDREAWSRRYREIGSAWIHTIHGLCTRILKENAIEARVDPHFTTLDETETLILMHQTVWDFINERLNRGAETMVQVLTAYGLRTARETLTQLLEQREKVSAWSERYKKQSDEDILKPLREAAREKVRSNLKALENLSCTDQEDKIEQLRQEVLSLLSGADLNREGLEDLKTVIDLRGGSKKKWGEEEFKKVKALLKALKVLSVSILPLYDEERVGLELGLLRALVQEFELLHDRYREEKSSQGFLDFEDLLIRTRDLLTQNAHVRDRYRKEIKTLLMDELQDTDPLQMEIVEHLCGDQPGRIFAVGDAKQSIYSFRGADVAVFQRFENETYRNNPDDLIPLTKNFRSQEEILNFINHLFSRIFPSAKEKQEDILFSKLDPHRGSIQRSHFVEGFFIASAHGEKKSAEVCREQEAAWIASRIRAMVENQEERILTQENGKRPVEYGDIAILFRAMTDVKIYEGALRKAGIPFTIISGSGFLEKQEVHDVLNMLRLLFYPEDEEALTGILRSPCIGVRDETLYFMSRGRSLSRGLQEAEEVQGINGQERGILVRARGMIEKLRRVRDRVTIPELIGRFLDTTCYPALLLTDPVHGQQRFANLRKLMDIAREFSAKPLFSLSDFIDYMDELRNREAREAESPVDEEGGDTVRILTVHKAKGLEFPVVFLPDLGRRNTGKSAAVEIHPDLGIGIRVPDNRGSFENSFIRSSILERNKINEINEEKRLFYVAATRARDFLVLSGQIQFSGNQKPDSAVPMDWLKEALGITEENHQEDIPYGDRKIKVFTRPEQADLSKEHEHTWIEKYPAILRGEPIDIPEDESVRPLLERAAHAPAPLPPGRFSVSQLLLFQKCPRGYELSALRGISEPVRETEDVVSYGGRKLGRLVHGILQHWNMDPSSVKDCVERELHRSGLAPRDREKIRMQAIKLVRSFAGMETAEEIRSAGEVYTEVPFLLNLDGFHIEGVIDKLYRNRSGRLTIIDYKTDKVTGADVPSKAEEYRFQLAAYALAVNRIFKEDVDTTLIFLHAGITHPFQIDPKAAETQILSMIREIQRMSTFRRNLERCPDCGYWKPFCSAPLSHEPPLTWGRGER